MLQPIGTIAMDYLTTLRDTQKLLSERKISAVELATIYLDRIDRFQGTLNTYITVTREEALAQAAKADRRIQSGDIGALTGVPLSLKDVILTRGIKTTCGSRILSNFVAPYNATVVDKLYQNGAVLLGKANMDEFAMGSNNENSAFGSCKNPWDVTRSPGGSSGGSAVSVAAYLAAGSLGTDTGGSIRLPASFCNLTAIKPTYGRVSRFGIIAFASSLDQVGPIARDVGDAAILLEAIAGHDRRDATSIPEPVPRYSQLIGKRLVRGTRLGIPMEYMEIDGIQDDIRSAVYRAIDVFESLGCTVEAVSLPHIPYAIATYYIIAPAEASANLARYDGVRYGHREARDNVMEMIDASRREGFGDEVKRRIMLGTYVLSTGYYDAYYRKAQQVRRLIWQDFVAAFDRVDAIISPTCPSSPFKLGEHMSDPVALYLADVYNVSVNLSGLPSLALPCGVDRHGLPVGMQLIGKSLDEETLFQLGDAYQNETDWHKRSIPADFK